MSEESIISTLEKRLELYHQYHPRTSPNAQHVSHFIDGTIGLLERKFRIHFSGWRNSVYYVVMLSYMFIVFSSWFHWFFIIYLCFFTFNISLNEFSHAIISDLRLLKENFHEMMVFVQENIIYKLKLSLSTQECPICFDQSSLFNPKEFIFFSCSHSLCKECASQWYGEQVQQGKSTFTCCYDGCHSTVETGLIKKILSNAQQFKLRYNSFLQVVMTLPEEEREPCSTPDCPGFFLKMFEDDFFVSCPACQARGVGSHYCFKCKDYHSREEHKQMKQNLSWNVLFQAKKIFKKMWWGDEDKVLKLNTAERLVKDWGVEAHKCPQCKVYYEKDNGCNHVTCSNCGAQFHWAEERDWSEFQRNHNGAYW